MRILLLGGSGQLGSEIRLLSKNYKIIDLISPNKKELDIRKKDDFENYLAEFKPNIVINSAAFTNVDGAEEQKDLSHDINFKAVENMVLSLKNKDVFFIHISTDYVFGEKGRAPYKNNDSLSPMTFYGNSKAEAELVISKNLKNFIIIRTASLIGLSGNNFFKTVMKNLLISNQLRIINNQRISMTWSKELAQIILIMCKDFPRIKELKTKILHIVNRGYTDWYELSQEIERNYSKFTNKADVLSIIDPISDNEWNSKAKRPLDSRLQISEEFFTDNNLNMSHWKDAIRLMVKDLEKEGGLKN